MISAMSLRQASSFVICALGVLLLVVMQGQDGSSELAEEARRGFLPPDMNRLQASHFLTACEGFCKNKFWASPCALNCIHRRLLSGSFPRVPEHAALMFPEAEKSKHGAHSASPSCRSDGKCWDWEGHCWDQSPPPPTDGSRFIDTPIFEVPPPSVVCMRDCGPRDEQPLTTTWAPYHAEHDRRPPISLYSEREYLTPRHAATLEEQAAPFPAKNREPPLIASMNGRYPSPTRRDLDNTLPARTRLYGAKGIPPASPSDSH